MIEFIIDSIGAAMGIILALVALGMLSEGIARLAF